MGKQTKLLLGLAVIFLSAGLFISTGAISVVGLPSVYVIFPVGAIFFGLFLVSKILEKEPVDAEPVDAAGGHATTPAKAGKLH